MTIEFGPDNIVNLNLEDDFQLNLMVIDERIKRLKLKEKEEQKLRVEYFIKYLEAANDKQKDEHFFEKVLIMAYDLPKKVIIYLLKKDIDINYSYFDSHYEPETLKAQIALNYQDKEIIELLLSKLDKDFYIYSKHQNKSIDLSRLYLYAHKPASAAEIIKNKSFNLLNIDYDYLKLYEELQIKDIVPTEENNLYDKDYLYNIIYALANTEDYTINEKQDFLQDILYCPKIRIINSRILLYIRFILPEKKFLQYLKYIINSQIIVVNYDQNNICKTEVNEKKYLKRLSK